MRSTERGFSLIELMMGVAILGLAGQQLASYSTRLEQDAQARIASRNAREQLLTSLNYIRKNMKSKRPETDLEMDSHKLSFQQEMTDGTFTQITISSLCRPLSQESFVVSLKHPSVSSCYESQACQGLSYVEIKYETPGAQPRLVTFPSLENMRQELAKQSGASGLALCFDKMGEAIKIQGISFVHSRVRNAPTQLTIEGMNSVVPIDPRNSISFIR